MPYIFFKCLLHHLFFYLQSIDKPIYLFQASTPITSIDISVKRVSWYIYTYWLKLLCLSTSINCLHIASPFILFISPPHSKLYMWALQQVWHRWSCIAVRCMGKPVLSAAWPEILTVHGMARPVLDLFPTANVASAGKMSDMGMLCYSVWIRMLAVRVHSSSLCITCWYDLLCVFSSDMLECVLIVNAMRLLLAGVWLQFMMEFL